jgi:hypothetical protein
VAGRGVVQASITRTPALVLAMLWFRLKDLL